ncbi:MAG: LysR family transcriptional regulator [Hyphomicrobiaceae bacterium]
MYLLHRPKTNVAIVAIQFCHGSSMDIKKLKTFICVADCGSIARASDRLRVAQPAISRQIKLLEHEAGVPLFHRHVRGMEVTEAGQELLTRVSSILYQLEQSMRDLQTKHNEIAGNVTLGLLPTIAEDLIVQLLYQARQQLPAVRIHMRECYSGTIVELLQSGCLDIALLYGPRSAYHFRATTLLSEKMVLVSAPESLDEQCGAVQLSDIADLPLALPSRQLGPHIHSIIDKAAKTRGVHLKSSFDVDSIRVMLTMVESGLCHALLPVSSVLRIAASGRVVLRDITPDKIRRQLILTTSSQRASTRAADAVSNLIKRQIAIMVNSGAWPAQPHFDVRKYLAG